MPFIALSYRLGARAPAFEEQLALAAMRAADTPDQLQEAPCGVSLNGETYLVDWRDNPPENAPADALDAFYGNGRCAKCGRLEGDHLDPWFSSTPPNACRFTEKLPRERLA